MKKSISILFSLILSCNLWALPSVKTGNGDIDRLILLAHDEVQKNIRSDGTFCAGAKWPTAWTRDMSYAIDLSLSFLFPEAVEKSLNSRVENGMILQDTGSGGSYPVSTDRITWITAAYDYALYKQSPEYFEKVFAVADKTLSKDYMVNFDSERGIFRGESSFLDWREQTYPRWATNEFIADSYALGTNMMYFSALQKTALLAEKTGKDLEIVDLWKGRADSLKKAILENFWLSDKKYFASLLLKDIEVYTYQGYETLGESLGVILELAPEDSYKNVISAVKAQKYGLSVVAPQLAGIPSYHNDAVWPFVQGYRGLACKKAGDAFNAQKEFDSMVIAAEKFGTFKENYVASTFSPETQTNSDRQLWSDAGFLAYIYRILFGLDFTMQGISVKPFVFSSFKNGIELKNLTFAGSSFSISIKGSGDKITKYLLNGKAVEGDYIIPYQAQASYNIQIELEESDGFKASYIEENQPKPWFAADTVTPAVPNVRLDADRKTSEVAFRPKNKGGWEIVYDGKKIIGQENTLLLKPKDTVILAQAFALPENADPNIPLFPSKVARAENTKNTVFYEAENADFKGGILSKDESEEYSTARISEELQKTEANCGTYIKDFGKEEGDYIEFTVNVKKTGDYALDFRFKNGHGPVNTGEKCALLAFSADGKLIRRLALPQQGSWSSWSFTAPTLIHLEKGSHKIRLFADQWCRTQHDALNPVHLDLLRMARIR